MEVDLGDAAQRRSAWLTTRQRSAGDPSLAASIADPGALEPSAATAPPLEAPIRTVGPFPLWLRCIDALQRASRSPMVVLVDLVIAIGCGVALGVPAASAAPVGAGLILALYLAGRYLDRGPLETQGVAWYLGQIAMPLAIATLIAVGVETSMHLHLAELLRASVATTGGLVASRGLAWIVIVFARRHGMGLRRALVVGDGPSAALVIKKLDAYPEAGLAPVMSFDFLEDRSSDFRVPDPGARLANVVREKEISEVVLAPEGSDGDEILRCVKTADGLETNFSILLPLSEVFLHPGLVTQVGGLPLISLGKIAQRRPTLPGKRVFDLAVASALLVIASPLLGVTALLIKVWDKGPVLFRQRRVGRDGKTFELLKFRSMVVGAERLIVDLRDRNANTGLLFKVYDDPRITRLGRAIRRLSIDELPQLWNVVRGDMSLVGPRPLAVEPEDFGAIENKRHSVPPGITGYWQIAGANDLTYEEMIKLDLAYIQNRSLLLDIWLLLRTPAALIHRRGPW